MRAPVAVIGILAAGFLPLSAAETLGARAAKYLIELTRRNTSNPPGNETRAARWLESIAKAEGIACESLGGDSTRLNFLARLPGNGKRRPLLLMAHSDVVPADPAQWSVDPFSGALRDGFIWGRGAVDDKSLLAAELAVMVELKRRGVRLARDIILLAESDEESGSTGIDWLLANAWPKIDAEFALNEGGFILPLASGRWIYQIQTAEKVPTRVILRAHGTAGHASLPLPNNPVVALSRAVVRLAEADQPVTFNATTRRYISALAATEEFRWLAPLLPRLHRARTAAAAANEIRAREPELDAQLRTTISPTMLSAGTKINVIPNTAEAQIDVRRLPSETAAEVVARLRRMVDDAAVEVFPAGGQEMPATGPSPLGSALYKSMEEVFRAASPGAIVVPFMQRGATDGSWLRQRGMPVYGVPLFLREGPANLAHANNERISQADLERGAGLLLKIVLAASR